MTLASGARRNNSTNIQFTIFCMFLIKLCAFVLFVSTNFSLQVVTADNSTLRIAYRFISNL